MSDAPQRPRILFLSGSDGGYEPALHLLRSLGVEIAAARGPEEALAWLRIHRADLAVVEIPDGAPSPAVSAVLEAIRGGDWSGNPRLLALTRGRGVEQLRGLFEQGLTNFLGVGEGGAIDPVELTATARKILSGDIFGLGQYMSPGARTLAFDVRSSRDKGEVVAAAEEFAVEAGCHRQIAEGFATAVDEALSNALYNAPVGDEGQPLYAGLPRTVPVELAPGSAARIELAADGRRLGMSSLDRFGSLAPAVVLDYLSRCFARRAFEPTEGSGGAGLGLYQLLHLVQHFIVNVAPGERTEVIGLIEIGPSFKRFSMKPRSFNLFVKEVG